MNNKENNNIDTTSTIKLEDLFNKLSIQVSKQDVVLEPTKIKFNELRNNRQQLNNKLVFKAIKSKNIDDIKKYSNENELERVLNETNKTIQDLLVSCSTNDIMNIILSGRISKKSSRQGNKDEETQLQICNNFSKNYGIFIEKLKNTEYRPSKIDGKIISFDEMKKNNILKTECLKSFDAKITRNMNAWIFAKVVYGNGGHQDNVFEEANILCEWIEMFHKTSNDLFVLLIDTDQITQVNILKEKFKHLKNILITDHYDFQKYIQQNYERNKYEQI
jgi:hypothetical protein